MSLKATSSNCGDEVFRSYKIAVAKYGYPKRIRGDRGLENLKVAEDIILHRGSNRGSFLWGT